jgi:hypothetical protein
MSKSVFQYTLSGSSFIGENFLAFETLELKACCNKNTTTELDEALCALSADPLIDAQTILCLAAETGCQTISIVHKRTHTVP